VKTKTAAEQRIRSLYHYQTFDEPARLERILKDGQIYCSNPADFNDPWDCRPCFSKTMLDNPAQYRRVVQWFVGTVRRRDPSIPAAEHDRREQLLLTDRPKLEWMIDQMTESMVQAMTAQYRVYCLSTHGDSPLMWSHYARSHQGVCLEFSVGNPLFCGVLPVEYLDHYPDFDLSDSDEDASLRPLLTKSSDWRYENEFRLVAAAPGYTFPGVLATINNFVTLPPGTLKSITVGCQMPASHRTTVRSFLSNLAPSVSLKAAYRVENRYALELRSID
jgi:hypothetical protein